jgi:hypothetical protein
MAGHSGRRRTPGQAALARSSAGRIPCGDPARTRRAAASRCCWSSQRGPCRVGRARENVAAFPRRRDKRPASRSGAPGYAWGRWSVEGSHAISRCWLVARCARVVERWPGLTRAATYPGLSEYPREVASSSRLGGNGRRRRARCRQGARDAYVASCLSLLAGPSSATVRALGPQAPVAIDTHLFHVKHTANYRWPQPATPANPSRASLADARRAKVRRALPASPASAATRPRCPRAERWTAEPNTR